MAFSVGKELLLKLRNKLQFFLHSNRKGRLKAEEVESIISLCKNLGPEHCTSFIQQDPVTCTHHKLVVNLPEKRPIDNFSSTSVKYQHVWENESVSMG